MIEATKDGALQILTLARPDKANALTKEMLTDLADGVAAAAADPETRAIILTGQGKAFSAGMDLEAARAGLPTDPVWERLSAAIIDAPCLTIAALNGTVAGGAMGMVIACDLRAAVPGAKFFYPVMKLGFLPQPSDPARLSALIGPARAKAILMAGARVTVPEALEMGLVNAIGEDPLALARDWAADASGASRDHVAAIKAMLRSPSLP